jgi:hypothetical protein
MTQCGSDTPFDFAQGRLCPTPLTWICSVVIELPARVKAQNQTPRASRPRPHHTCSVGTPTMKSKVKSVEQECPTLTCYCTVSATSTFRVTEPTAPVTVMV